MEKTVYVYDELHGYIKLAGVFRDIVSTKVFQRLRRIRQLPFAWYVYPGATHTRFSHTLGSMYIAELIAQRLSESGYISRDDVSLVKVCALLHDIGHAPYSHSLEPLITELWGTESGDLVEQVIASDPELREVMEKYGISFSEVISVLRGRSSSGVLNDMISSDIDVDRLDYLPRDAYHTGVAYGNIDLHRLALFLTPGSSGMTVPLKALNALESFYIARLHMYKAVYYHKTITGYQILLRNIYSELLRYGELRDVLEPYVSPQGILNAIREGYYYLWDDYLVSGLLNYALSKKVLSPEAESLIFRLLNRRGYKAVVSDVRMCWSYREIATKFSELRAFIESETSLIPPKAAIFVEAVPVYTLERPARVVVEGVEQKIVDIEESIVRYIPSHVCFTRLYVLPEYVEEVRAALLKFFKH
ncbi:MAG: HD domain-containing protein [Sulfolobales archaeon]|nr:HD domain-containing protein [Sulfolobales archaeon]MDW8083475.1 HD domain-containing protein [Sulfolobales archaeon]